MNTAKNTNNKGITTLNPWCITKNGGDHTQKTHTKTRWWFQCFLCSPLFGEDSHFDYYFSKGLKPPTRKETQKFFTAESILPENFAFTTYRRCGVMLAERTVGTAFIGTKAVLRLGVARHASALVLGCFFWGGMMGKSLVF